MRVKLPAMSKLKTTGKAVTAFVCGDCGAEYGKWQGQCGDCNAWNTISQVVLAPARAGRRPPSGGHDVADGPADATDRSLSAALMRVNHAGEIAAQALYVGQAIGARRSETRSQLLEAAREERDHLDWCRTRLDELDARPSLLAPFWYAGSFGIGLAAGSFSDAISLGFVAETEQQVEAGIGGIDGVGIAGREPCQHGAGIEAAGVEEIRAGAAGLEREPAEAQGLGRQGQLQEPGAVVGHGGRAAAMGRTW